MLLLPHRNVLLLVVAALVFTSSAQLNSSSPGLIPQDFSLFDERQDCPPCPKCFNCNLEDFQCMQFGNCTRSNGKCACPAGFGDDDCSQPLCGSLPKGKDRPIRPKEDELCECDDGWEGILCNLCNRDRACNPMMPHGEDGVCYTGGLVQNENHQDCDITNPQIVSQLDPKKAKATFSCNNDEKTCKFQFWIDALESFYCGLDTCEFHQENESNRNVTKYQCENIACRCVPNRQLCEDAGVNIGDILAQIRGPGFFTTRSTEGGDPKDGSVFSEKHLNDLVAAIFGDDTIKLKCKSTECLYKFEVPGYERPQKAINTPLIAGVIAGCALFVVAVVLVIFFLSRRPNRRFGYGAVHLTDDDDESSQLMMDHKPTSLHFENVSYDLNNRKILSNVQGAVHPGELLAIMGASGAGKTTFLDILARKNKRGYVRGEFYVNGERVQDEEFRSVIGFVDQEDTMLPTLTVHETIQESALLRLPKDMSLGAKLQRVEDVEKQLGIHQIRDQIIGSEEGAGRGISGGEKRRVGIACELVTSPRILFLDEPTSGLDAFNAYNVVECLVNLVKTYNRTVVFTIHQPRSNIVALFDHLILLAQGRTVYSGPFASCQAYFDNVGYSCPPGFNIADYLVDLTMHAGVTKSPMDDIIEAERRHTATRASSAMAIKSIPSESYLETNESQSDIDSPSIDRESRPRAHRRASIKLQQERQLFTRRKSAEVRGVETPASAHSEEEHNLLESSQEPSHSWLRLSKQPGPPPPQVMDDPHLLPPEATISNTDLEVLIDSYLKSDVAASVRDDIREALGQASNPNEPSDTLHRVNGGVTVGKVRGYRRVGIWTQFKILSVRTWRNIYRNPMLMLTHYAIAILLAVLLGFLFFGITDDIAGFQNRLGLFFFILALWGFSTLTSLTVFASERLLFMRERAKGYYVPISYFTSKVLFDIIPLRLVPPIILGAIVYPMTGLVPAWPQFWLFILFLVLFNFAAAAICLFIGIIFRNGGVANLIGSLVMLGSLLFAGSLLNKNSIPPAALWLQSLSIFHYGFEGLIVNEVRYLRLIDQKYGLDIEVPGSAILSSFGFDTLALPKDAIALGIICAVFIVIAYASMHILLVERR